MKKIIFAIATFLVTFSLYAPAQEMSKEDFRTWAVQNEYVEKVEDITFRGDSVINVSLIGQREMQKEDIKSKACFLASDYIARTGYIGRVTVNVIDPASKKVELKVPMNEGKCGL